MSREVSVFYFSVLSLSLSLSSLLVVRRSSLSSRLRDVPSTRIISSSAVGDDCQSNKLELRRIILSRQICISMCKTNEDVFPSFFSSRDEKSTVRSIVNCSRCRYSRSRATVKRKRTWKNEGERRGKMRCKSHWQIKTSSSIVTTKPDWELRHVLFLLLLLLQFFLSTVPFLHGISIGEEEKLTSYKLMLTPKCSTRLLSDRFTNKSRWTVRH